MKQFFISVIVVIVLLMTSTSGLGATDHIDFLYVFENHGSIMWLIDAETGIIKYANRSAHEFYGFPGTTLIGTNIYQINTLSAEQLALERQAARDEERNFFLFTHRLFNGEIRNVEVYSYPVSIDNRTYLFSVIVDVTDRLEMQRSRNIVMIISGVLLIFLFSIGINFAASRHRLKTQRKIEFYSFHDFLTGLYNRRFFEEELHRLDTLRNLPISIVMADVDNLKTMNDSFGHDSGDELLKKTADVLRKELRADEIIARIGGDEFVVLLPKTDAPSVEKLIQRLNDAFSSEFVKGFPVSVSFGWSTKTDASQNIRDVIRHSEDLMYQKKILNVKNKNLLISKIMKSLQEKSLVHEDQLKKVSEYSVQIGEALGLDKDDLTNLVLATRWYDIGKIAIDHPVLQKRGKLTIAEFQEMQRHSEAGHRILSNSFNYYSIAEIALTHHERWDGTGYPNGLAGHEIPLQARIIAIAEAFEAMTNDRPYRAKYSIKDAAKEIKRCSGTQFDPEIARLFIEDILKIPLDELA